jgi:hypothetical protein
MQPWMKVAAAVGILAIAGLVYRLRSDGGSNDLASARSYNARLMCRACGNSFPGTIGKSDRPPIVCKKCGKQEAWPEHQCYDCGNRFVPELEGNPPRIPVVPHCTKCKSVRVGGVPPE